MTNIFDTAKYILEKSGPITMYRLQKLCYYSKAWTYVWDGTELFKEHFEAYAYGPVCPELFKITKALRETVKADDIDSRLLSGESLTDGIRSNINEVIRAYSSYNDDELAQLSMDEDPWRSARKGIPPGMKSDAVITENHIKAYYTYLYETEDARRRYEEALEEK